MKQILLLGLFLSLVAQATSGFHNYDVKNFPKGETSCLEEASQLAEKVRIHAGVSIYRSDCLRDGEKNMDLRVTYVAEEKLPVVTTVNKLSVTDGGLFRTEESCVSDLPSEIANFKDATNLNPVISFCSRLNHPSPYSFLPVAQVIESLGESKNQSFIENVFISGRVVGKAKILQPELTKGIEAMGLIFPMVVFDRDTIGLIKLKVRYYGPKYVYLTLTEELHYQEPEHCLAQIPEAKRVLSLAKEPTGGVFCIEDFSRGATLSYLVKGYMKSIQHELAPDTYSSLQDCFLDRDRMIAFYQESLKRDVFGALCDHDFKAKRFRMHVFENPVQGP